MYRTFIKRTKSGKWLSLCLVSSPWERSYELCRMLEKCEIYAYKVEWQEPKI